MARAKTSKLMEMDMMGGMGIDWTSAIISVVLKALGLWFLIGGFVTQFNVTGRTFDWWVALWYVVGIALIWYGKVWSNKTCCNTYY
ncbi:MAG: hypothetical protein V1776_03025 [Candidatus Diapherotrites archaeon]